ncbi:MAG: hypothetical protein JSV22_10340 [Bacteroidales bacterium]|nr:MAG: hypothetical protein JSV22_10340 [Bacteroidales bacterium]
MRILESNNINGILGTILFHLALVLFFLLVKVGDVRRKQIEYFPIEFEEELMDIEEIIKEIETMQAEIEPLEEELRRNIAVNVAEQMNARISTEKYIEELKEEMGIENLEQYLDRSLPDEEIISYSEEQEADEEESDTEEEYSGPTNVTYFLENRSKKYLPIPVYTCKGGGLVVVDIIVNPAGKVIATSISKDSDTGEQCLLETAIKYAFRTRFNTDYNAESRQKGYISYQFIPQ